MMADLARVTVERHGPVTLARLAGEIDMSNAADVERRVLDGPETGPLVLDLTGVGFLDSAGLALLDEVHRRCRARGRVLRVVAVAGSPPRRAITLAGLDEGLTIDGAIDKALAAADASG